MQVIIIEDEILTAEDLSGILLKLPYTININRILPSVKQAVEYLRNQPPPDLIFCDIHLGDGHSFEIFKQVKTITPVIFCTAYNEYALEAFNNNGIGYVLKPFTKKTIKEAIDKYLALKSNAVFTPVDFSKVLEALQTGQQAAKNTTLLVNWKDKILPVRIDDIALFSIEYRAVRLFTKSGADYIISQTLDELELMCGSSFYRANRQFLINKTAVQEVQQYTARKLLVKMGVKGNFDITIAKAKVPEFLSWLKS
ncbi:MAG TPA: LytTR family DNA-binding domain-containing protein [Ferruginibacter sp.]|nr:LytTR family DNA-binding domain-containing protein [Ferruginibacter sp.]HMP21516.1 LytTR family DNA-binding domain-containing protein [Ferruginibacter sp.]